MPAAYAPLPADLQALFEAAQAHRHTHGCSAHPFGDGAALFALAQAEQPQQILELGTGVGYTAALMAAACPAANIDTLEGDETHMAEAQALFEQRGIGARVRLVAGSFADTLGGLPLRHYQLIFFDGHMPPLILIRHLAELMATGGLLVCSNMRLRGTRGAPRVEAQLLESGQWQRLGDIEGGNTWVLRRL